MRCPRCGLEDSPADQVCPRCGLPPGTLPPGAPSIPPPEEQTQRISRAIPIQPRGPQRPQPGSDRDESAPEPSRPRHRAATPEHEPPSAPPPAQGPPRLRPVSAAPREPKRPLVVREPEDTLGLAVMVVCVVAAVTSLGYAVWSLTARRAVFSDLASGPVSADRVSSSDTIDSILTICTVVVLLLGFGFWSARQLSGRVRHPRLSAAALGAGLIGMLVVVAGLLLENDAVSHATREGRADATVVGLIVASVGSVVASTALGVGSSCVRIRQDPMPELPASAVADQGW